MQQKRFSKQISIYAAVVFSMVFWGCSFVWTAVVFKYWDPITTIFVRLIISAFVIFLALVLSGKLEKIKPEDYKLLFLSAIFNPFLYFLGENFGVKYSTPTIAAVIISTIPIFSLLAARYAYGERMSFVNVLGMIISIAGVVLMLFNDKMEFTVNYIGVLCLVFAVVTAVVYSVLLKRLSGKYNAFTIVGWQNLIGVFLFFPIFLYVGYDTFLETKFNYELISSVILLSVFASTLAFVLYTYSTRELGISRTNVFVNLIPVITALFSWYILREEMGLFKISGIVMVLMGLFLSQMKFKKVKQ